MPFGAGGVSTLGNARRHGSFRGMGVVWFRRYMGHERAVIMGTTVSAFSVETGFAGAQVSNCGRVWVMPGKRLRGVSLELLRSSGRA